MGNRNETILAVHRALVETYALKEAGLPLVMDWSSGDPTDDYARRVAKGARFEQDTNGQMKLVFESEELRQSILECVTPQAQVRSSDDGGSEDAETEEQFSEEGAASRDEDGDINSEVDDFEIPVPDEELSDYARWEDLTALTPASESWRNVSLEDASIKFAASGP